MAVSGGRSPVAGHRLLAAVASLVVERRLLGLQAAAVAARSSVVVACRP